MEQVVLISIPVEELQNMISLSVEKQFKLSGVPQPIEKEEEFLKIPAVAELLKISPVTVFDWKQKGILPYHRMGKRIFFKRSEVLEAVKKFDKRVD